MKTTLLTVLLSCTAISAFAQGVVQFRTFDASSTPPVDARVYLDWYGGTPLDNSNPLWRAALVGGPTTGTPYEVRIFSGHFIEGNLQMLYNPVNTTLSWVNFRAPPNAGYVNVAAANRLVPGVDWGGTALVQMVAWQGNYTTWADAFAACRAGVPGVLAGVSNPLTLTLPTGPTSPNLTYLVGLRSFGIGPTPEPGACALAMTALLAFLIFRRRN